MLGSASSSSLASLVSSHRPMRISAASSFSKRAAMTSLCVRAAFFGKFAGGGFCLKGSFAFRRCLI
jgi:hypothetical protein